MKLNIVYSTDNNYAKYAGVSIISLFENNKSISSNINLYIINNKISKKNKENLDLIAQKYNTKINYISFDEICCDLNNTDDFFKAAYARLFLSKLEQIDKILYIDCDTIINGSIQDLYNLDIDQYYVAGVQDNPGKYLVDIIGMSENDRYLNSGVLLFNLKKFRQNNIQDKILKFIDRYNGKVPHHDQGVINGVCKGKILIIHPKFNCMSQFWELKASQIMKLYDIKNYYKSSEVEEAISNPIIIHYINKFYDRPWTKSCSHPMKHLYIKFLEISPWSNDLIESKKDIKVEMRKFIFSNLPFNIYYRFEKFLDIKRMFYYKKKYRFLK